MTTSDTQTANSTEIATREEPRDESKDESQDRAAAAPGRPSLTGKEAAPVLVKLPPPFFVRLSQIAWLLSLIAGGVGIVYLFIIRQAQLADIEDLVRTVDGSRAD